MVLSAHPADCGQLRIIELQYRPADEIIRIVKPLLGADETISGEKYVIFLTAAPQKLTRIESIIRTLDMPLRHLLITVVQGENAEEALDSVDASGNISIGDHTRIAFGRNRQNPDCASITGSGGSSVRSDHDIQQLRVLEGVPARIVITYSVPVSNQTIGPRAPRSHHGTQVEFAEATTGFTVTARLSTDRFVLDIVSQRESHSAAGSGAVDSQQIQTQVDGRLNQWIDIGGALGVRQWREAGLVYHDEYRKQVLHQVFLKLVEVNP